MPPDNSTLVALVGLVGFFVCLVFLWIIGFRHYEKRMVTTERAPTEAEQEQRDVHVVEVPVAGAVDGGPLLGGRVMWIADRDTEQRRTVRQVIAPPAPATPIFPVSIPSMPSIPDFVPDETPPQDVAQQQTQALPVVSKPVKPRPVIYVGRDVWLLGNPMPADMQPRDYLN